LGGQGKQVHPVLRIQLRRLVKVGRKRPAFCEVLEERQYWRIVKVEHDHLIADCSLFALRGLFHRIHNNGKWHNIDAGWSRDLEGVLKVETLLGDEGINPGVEGHAAASSLRGGRGNDGLGTAVGEKSKVL
jgi:hypothetical protein